MGTKNNPGKYDCASAAAPDEPTFTLVGRDPQAGELVRLWVVLRGYRDDHGSPEEDEKRQEALACARSMDAYVRAHRSSRMVEQARACVAYHLRNRDLLARARHALLAAGVSGREVEREALADEIAAFFGEPRPAVAEGA